MFDHVRWYYLGPLDLRAEYGNFCGIGLVVGPEGSGHRRLLPLRGGLPGDFTAGTFKNLYASYRRALR